MKTKALMLASALSLAFACNAHGATQASGLLVSELSLNRQLGNVVFVRLSQTPTGSNGCSTTNWYWHYTISLDDAIGKNIYAALLATMAAGISVSVNGAGACNEYGGVETLFVFNPKP